MTSLGSDYFARTVTLDELPPEFRRSQRERRWEANGIPRRLWPMLHDGAPDETVGPLAARPTPALDAASRFLSPTERRTLLVLSGVVGSGKTVAAAWAAAWNGGRFVKAIEILRQGVYPSDPSFLVAVKRAAVLVVDDLGAEPLDAKGYALATIEGVLDERYDSGRKTVVTTNVPVEVFKVRFGDRVWRRVVESGLWIDLPEVVR